MRAWTVLAVVAALCVALPACKRKDPNAIDAAAFDAIATNVQDQLNAPGQAIYQVLHDANEKPQVGWETLTIPVANQAAPEPVNWWLQKKGWIVLDGAQFNSRAVFSLTDAAKLLIEDPDQDWFAAKLGDDTPQVDCNTAEAMAVKGCAVVLTVVPSLTDAGKTMLGDQALTPIKVHAIVFAGSDDWQIPTLATDGPAIEDIALTTILGPKDARGAAVVAAGDDIASRLRALAQQNQTAAAPKEAYVEPPPVAAIGVENNPKAVLGLGLPQVVRDSNQAAAAAKARGGR